MLQKQFTKMRLHFLSLWALSVAATCQAQTLEQQTCNVDRMYADHNMAAADVALGFVAELRDASSTGTGCGEVGYEYVMLWEAARWTVNQLNSNNYVNGVKFGLRGYDTCGSAHRAIASMNHFYQQFSASSMYCNQTSSKLNLGVVGTMSSTTTKPIAALSTNFPTSVISPLAVSPQLSDKSEYPYFLRTRFSAVDQIKTMLSTMVTLKWERIIIIYTDNDYGRDYYNEFIKLSQNNQVCVVAAISVPGSPNLPAYMERLKAVGTLDVTAAAFFGVHSAATMMLSAIENLNNSAQNLQFMLTSLNLGLPITVNRARGLLVVLPSYTEVTEFYDYWTASIDANNPPPENPWYKDWFMRTFQCRLQGVNYEPYVRYSDCDPKSPAQKRAATNTRIPYLDTTVKAVLTYAKALKTAHQQTCGNQPGLCLGLRQMTAEQFHNNYLKVVDFDLNEFGITSLNGKRVKYDITGDFYMAGHDIFNANNQPIGGAFTFKKVGDFMDGKLNLNTSLMYFYNDPRTAPLPSIPTSPCPPSGCKNCLVPREMVHFNYKPGDIVLAGLFDLHSQGSEVLTCGSLKAVHALNAAAFTFAVERVKQQFSILPGVNLGSLIIDLCDNAETGRILLNDLLAGRTIVADVHGTVVDPNLIYTVVGELDSTEAMSMATMLGYFSRPYIESSATSVELSNKDKYEMFSRAVPSDYHQMMAIVLLLKKMNWNYVQVVHSPNAYGRTGYKTIRDEGAKRSICVATSQEIGKDGTLATIVRNLNEKPEARIVIAIVDSYDYRTMLQALKDQNLVGRFILIGTETWGKRMSIVSGLQSAAEGSITLDIDGPNIQDFRTWLDGKNPSDMTIARDMPFLVEWYQYAYSCYLDAQNKGVYTNQCNPNLPLTQATKYEESAYTPFMITATYAAARAIDATLRVYCGDANRNYNGICWQFRSNRMVPVNIQDYLENSTFNLDAFPFKMVDGEGKASYSIYSYSGGLYTKIGTYLTERSELSMPQNPASLPAGFTSVCSGSCSECVYLVQTEPFWSIPFKDLNLGVNFAAHDPGSEPFLCSGIRLTNGFQSYLAVKYAIEQVNNKLAPVGLNNVSLGAFMLDHCNSPARAYGMPAALYSGIFDTMFEGAPNLNTIRGWLTDNNLVTAEMKDFFSDFNLPVISTMGSANKFLNDEEYPTFARTFQGDSTIASALAVFIQSMGFRYVSFVYSDDEDGRTGLETFKDIAVKEGICIIKAIQMGNMTDDALVADLVALPSHVVVTYIGQGDMDKLLTARGKNSVADGLLIISPEPYPMLLYRHGLAAKNVLSLRMKTNVLEKYQKSLTDITDFSQSIMREYYMALFKCNLPGEYRYSTSCGPLQKLTSSPIFYQDNYILPIINAVYSFVQAAHHTLREQCGDNYNGMCARFYTDVDTNSILYDKLKTIGFSDDSRSTFSFIGQEGNTRREIALFDGAKMRTFADFTGATIEGVNVNTFKNVRSSCNSPCTQCLANKMKITFIPGEILLGGIFDVHKSSLEAFSCGEINTLHGFQLLEAFQFALNKVNDKTGQFGNILKNVKIGGVGLDACQSAVRGGFLISNIFSGLTKLFQNDQFVDPDKIDTIVGTYSSGRSIHLGRILKSLQLPQISYGSTSVTLADADRYPYFIRTVPADDRQVTAMVKFLREFDIRYVQIVHTADNYGKQGAATFKRIAADNKVCVAQTISFLDKAKITLQNADDIVSTLLQKPVANTVVVFADSSHINELLQAVKRYPEAHKKFKFIGSDTWANNVESTQGVENFAVGAVTFDLDVKDIPEFDQYLSTKTPANYPENPWFGEYYEAIHNCYLTIPNARYPERCRGTQNIVTSPQYKQDTGIIHVINAVYAAAYGLDEALKIECGANYTTVCEKFKNRDMRRLFLLNKTKEVEFTDPSGSKFSFYNGSGDGKMGYIMYSLESAQANTYAYTPIGRYSIDGELSVTSGYRPIWDSSCKRADSCTECPAIRDLITRYMFPMTSTSNTDTLIFLTNVHDQGNDEYLCGKMAMIGILNALSFVYKLANTTRFRPLVIDNCDNPIRIDQDLLNIFARGQLCNERLNEHGNPVSKSNIVGVITTGSRFVVAANRVTAPNQITLLGTISSSIALSNKENYPYFARMVPPDSVQMEVIARILKTNGWSYIGVIYSKESYGINAFRELQRIVNDGKYSCIGSAVGVGVSDSPEDIRPAVRTIAEVDGINVIVLLIINPTEVLQAIKAEGLDKKFVVIGADTWSNVMSVVESFQGDEIKNFRGAITVGIRDAFYDPFYNWLKNEFSWNKRLGLPDDWFEEFYQNVHECKLANPKTAVRVSYSAMCLENEMMTLEKIDKLKSHGVGLGPIAASHVIIEAYIAFQRDLNCFGKTFAECTASPSTSRVNLFKQTLDTKWSIPISDVSSKETFNVELGEDRYWDVGYSIYTLTIDGNDHYAYKKIGSHMNDVFTFNSTSYALEGKSGIRSACPESQICDCVVDDKPTSDKQVNPKYMRDHEPRNYFVYDEDTGKKVLNWPIWAIAVGVLTCIGLLVGILLFFYFLIFYPVRGGTTFLGFLVMLGILCIYAINFAFFYPASKDTCGIREFLMGVVYAIALAPLLVKAVDNWRFKDTEFSPDRYVGLTSPVSLVLIAIGIILVQCIIPIEWLILKPPSASLMQDSTLQHDWMWCDPHDFYDISIVLSMVLIIFLVVLTAIFSALSWDSESNYFESRWIFVSCVCTAGCFLVWMIVSTSAGPPFRDPAIAIGNLLNATALLICNPFRKLVLLIKFSSEEEKAKRFSPDDANGELYSNVYNNQMYQPDAVPSNDSKVPSENGYQ